MSKVTFDYSKATSFISNEEVESMKKIAEDAKKVLVDKTGAGNDFLGWIDLPVNYDKEEFDRIKKAAKKIRLKDQAFRACGRDAGLRPAAPPPFKKGGRKFLFGKEPRGRRGAIGNGALPASKVSGSRGTFSKVPGFTNSSTDMNNSFKSHLFYCNKSAVY